MNYNIKEIQKLELDMLNECKRLCEKFGIPYFLSQGTLIGAAREQGFIPWDDDMDILVPCEAIDQLAAVFSAEGDPRYLFTNHHVEKYYPHAWSKIRIKNTTSMPVIYKSIPINWGICIDVFPVYPISSNPVIQKAEIFIYKLARKLLFATMTECEEKVGAINRLIEKIPLSVRRRLADAGFRIFNHHPNDTEYVFVTCRGGRVFKRDVIFGPETKLQFEGELYPVPAKYHEYLTAIYGDYMTPPPEEEQGGHDLRMGEIIWDCKNGYEIYK